MSSGFEILTMEVIHEKINHQYEKIKNKNGEKITKEKILAYGVKVKYVHCNNTGGK